ncbi:DNA internalization-related competence protein ComEC/Rec2 [Paenibacillus sp.]|uniref:DNA internalization-related competence protein ComEC/Rec2 n=1 Tax=Paenibacillus sp. TaxID=58172 RepID=UPI002810D651|nr:DNA internalization-related competence protein ComEC/Rec2 [Paenibacillus sp.]
MQIRRPLLWICVGWMGGMTIASRFDAGWIALGGLTSAIFVLLWAGTHHGRNALTACAVAAAFAIGGGWFERYDAGNTSAIPFPDGAEEAVVLSGVIRTKPVTDGDRATFDLTVERMTARGEAAALPREVVKVYVYFKTEEERNGMAEWARGDRATVTGTIRRPLSAVNFGGFDYREYLRRQHIHWTATAEGLASVERSEAADWSAPRVLSYVDRIRDGMGARIAAAYDEPVAGFMKGLVLGIREDVDPAKYQAFSQVGLTHILAISGLNVAIYVGAILWLLGKLPLTRETRLVAAIAAVPVYVLLTGASPSVVRAGIMAMIALYAARRRLLKDGMNVLAAAALLMLAWNPYFLYDVSFQLSFAVTAGIILGTPLMNRLVRIGRPAVQSAVSVTVIAQCVSFPLTVAYFNAFSILSFPANFVIVPLFSLGIMPLGSIAMLLSYVWPGGAGALAYVAELLTSLSFRLVTWMSGYDGASSIWATPPLWWIGAYYASLFALLAAAANKLPFGTGPGCVLGLGYGGRALERLLTLVRLRAFLVPACAVVYAGALLYAYAPNAFDRTAVVSFLDVGQGDAIYIRTPYGKHLLIDGGGTVRFGRPGEEWRLRKDPFEVGEDVVVPLLRKRGVQRIDALLMSHGDTDHIGGLRAVVDGIPVRRVFFNGTAKEGETSETLFRAIVAKRIPLTAAYEGMIVRADPATELRILFPKQPSDENDLFVSDDQNERSVVVLMRVYGKTFLFTGDIGAAEEAAIAEALRNETEMPSPIDVLKVAHHGSKTSTTAAWLNYWKPKAAAISVGRSNMYGHPHSTVVERLDAASIRIYRTDVHGEIQFRVRKDSFQVRTKVMRE